MVAWLASEDAADVTGRVIEIEGGRICVETGWQHGPAHDLGERWPTAAVGDSLRALLREAPPPSRCTAHEGRTSGSRRACGRVVGLLAGERTVSWSDRDPILFALAVGARPDQLDLVFEERLRVLPSFALTLAQWAPDVLGGAGAFEVGNALHGSQSLQPLAPLPARGELTMSARVSGVWDKGSAAVYE